MPKREDQVPEWIDRVRSGRGFPCPVCETDEWDQSPAVGLQTVEIDDDGNASVGPTDPSLILIPILCPKCGLTLFLDAQTARIIGRIHER